MTSGASEIFRAELGGEQRSPLRRKQKGGGSCADEVHIGEGSSTPALGGPGDRYWPITNSVPLFSGLHRFEYSG